jgi:hypothetical protein
VRRFRQDDDDIAAEAASDILLGQDEMFDDHFESILHLYEGTQAAVIERKKGLYTRARNKEYQKLMQRLVRITEVCQCGALFKRIIQAGSLSRTARHCDECLINIRRRAGKTGSRAKHWRAQLKQMRQLLKEQE